jgi:hypothetical protein
MPPAAFTLESLERRVLHSAPAGTLIVEAQPSAAPAAAAALPLTKTDRRSILSQWAGADAPRLARFLRVGNSAAFDQRVLADTNVPGRPTLLPGVAALTSLAASRGADQAAVVASADAIVAGQFPEQMTSTQFTVPLPAGVSWLTPRASKNPEFPHVLNRHPWWPDLALATRLTGDPKYADALVAQLSSWSDEVGGAPASALPWGMLNTAVRTDRWLRAYAILRGTPAWTPAVNTLFLARLLRHGQSLADTTPTNFRINKTLFQGRALISLALMLPDLAPARDWLAKGQAILFRCLDAQFHADGGHFEQSPAYHGDVLRILLDAYQLMTASGVPWKATATRTLRRSVDAFLQLLQPDGRQAALSDSYREDGAQTIRLAGALLNEPAWKGRLDTFTYALRVIPADAAATATGLPARPGAVALPHAGYYATRTGSDASARQLIFDAGAKGGVHGHYDLLNLELHGYGKPLIADPGLYRYDDSTDRAWAISTPAHNTISVDDRNHATVDRAGSAITVDTWEVADDHVLIAARHRAYADLAGAPTVARTIWHDRGDAFLVIDFAAATASHTYASSFLLPTERVTKFRRGVIRTATGTGDVLLQPLPIEGQTAAVERRFTSSQAPPDEADPAYRFAVSQTGETALIATLVATYTGTTPPAVSARWIRTPTPSRTGRIELTRDGTTTVIPVDYPDLPAPSRRRTPTSPAVGGRTAGVGSSLLQSAPTRRTPFAAGRPWINAEDALDRNDDPIF